MKKLISILLSILCVFMSLAPAFAADEVNNGTDGAEEVVYHNVEFVAAPTTGDYENAYIYVKTINGVPQFVPDENGIYCAFKGTYAIYDELMPQYQEKVTDERFSPVLWQGVNQVAEGETVSFKVITSTKFNVLTVSLRINGVPVSLNAQDEYAVSVQDDLRISVVEEVDGQPVLLRNHYNVKLTSDEGYKLLTLKNDNYRVIYYGDSFDFRLKVLSGYTAAGATVSVQRGPGILEGLLEEEDSDMILGIIGGSETLTSYGVDEDGCRLYRIDNITSDCKIIVSGIDEEANAGIMAMFKRIIRFILNIFGIEIGFLDSLTAYYNVTIDGAQAPDGVTYQVIRSTSDDITPDEFNVGSGDGVTVIVTKKSMDQVVNVTWTPGNELGTYKTDWKGSYNKMTGETTYSAVYNIDNITADTVISITG